MMAAVVSFRGEPIAIYVGEGCVQHARAEMHRWIDEVSDGDPEDYLLTGLGVTPSPDEQERPG